MQVRTLAESVEAIGLGSWKLRGTMSKPFEVLAAVIEGTWRQAFDQQLSLYPLPQVRALLLMLITALCLYRRACCLLGTSRHILVGGPL